MIEAQPTMTIKSLNETLREVFSQKQHVSDVTVSRALQDQLITLKLYNITCTRVGYENTGYIWMRLAIISTPNVPMDEHHWVCKWWTVGVQSEGNVTLIAAVSDEAGLLYHEMYTSSVNNETVTDYITTVAAVTGEEELCHPDGQGTLS